MSSTWTELQENVVVTSGCAEDAIMQHNSHAGALLTVPADYDPALNKCAQVCVIGLVTRRACYAPTVMDACSLYNLNGWTLNGCEHMLPQPHSGSNLNLM